jgi:CRP-like cAMP-binding protein
MRVGAGNLIGTMEWGDGRHWASNAVAAQHGTVVGVLSLAALESLGEVALEDGFSENLTVMMLRLAFSHAMHELTERMSDRVIMDERFDLKPQEGALEAHPEVFRWLLGESDSPTYESLRFVNSMQAARMRPGQVVMRVGDHVRALLVLMEGKVHSKLSETVLETLDPGSIVAVEHLMSHKSCKTDFVVAEDAILLIMSWDQLFHEFLSQPGVFGYSVMHSLVSLAAEHTVRDMTVVKAPKRKPAVKKGASLLVTAKAKAAFKSKVPKAKEAKLAAKLSAAETIQSDVGVDVRVRMLMHVQRTSPVWRMLSRSQLRPIAEVFHVFTVEPGERIVKRGERASFFGLVLSGEVYSEYAGEVRAANPT